MANLEEEYTQYIGDEVLLPEEAGIVPPLTATSIIITLSATVFFLGFLLFNTTTSEQAIRAEEKVGQNNSVLLSHDPFLNIILEARAAVVWDVNQQKILFARNEQAQLPLASLTKLMTALVVHEILPEETVVTIDSFSLSAEGDSGFYVNERWRVRDLLDITLLSSSNDGARALAATTEALNITNPNNTFVDRMNKKAKEIGLTQTYFLNETGLDTNNHASGGFGSARDIAQLMEYIIRHAYDIITTTQYEEVVLSSLDNIDHTVQNTNKIVSTIPRLIASKTGFTDLAGGNLVVAFDASINHLIIATVLGSTLEGRFRDMELLINATLEKLAQ